MLIVIKMPGSSVSYILCHIHGRFEINGIIDDDRDLLVKIRIEFRKRRAGKICRFLGSVLLGQEAAGGFCKTGSIDAVS